jgi:aspartate-semialdehyde dehydrogenase
VRYVSLPFHYPATLTLTPRFSSLSSRQPTNNPPGVLGATGSVGQRFILLLAQHPHLKLHAVGASSRSAGKKYKDAVKWKQAMPMSKELAELVVKECKASEFAECDVVFSGLDSDVAGEIGECCSDCGWV